MSALDNARALVAELREIHARSRENAREQGWGVPPEAEDHSPWSRAADMIEVLTAPPTDDEREELRGVLFYDDHGRSVFRFASPRVLEEEDEFIPAMIPAVLAAGFRRRGPITDEMRELIAEARKWPRDGINEGVLINRLADALEAAGAVQ